MHHCLDRQRDQTGCTCLSHEGFCGEARDRGPLERGIASGAFFRPAGKNDRMSTPFSFDDAVFRSLVAELGGADALEVLQVFLADSADKIARLGANNQGRPQIKREAHSIKSSAATFGFIELSTLAKELEFGAETMTPAKLQESIFELRQVFETTRQFAQVNLLNAGLGMAT
jgi:HPt (histidine-containing phosphotransfer) domain-containing protein